MIFNKRWKKELKKLSRKIKFWSRFHAVNEYAMYQLTRAVLYSAIVIRKAIEDEQEAETIAKQREIILPKRKILRAELSAIKYPFTGEEGWTVRGTLPVSEYGKGYNVRLQTKDVCNWIIHSYHWGVASSSGKEKYAGFLVASDFDKEKFVHYISFNQWIEFVNIVIKYGKF